MSTIQIIILRDGKPDTLGLSELKQWLSGEDAPAPTKPDQPAATPPGIAALLGALAGKHGNNSVYQAADGNWYYEIDNGTVIPRGTNLDIALAPGAKKLTGNPCPIFQTGVPQTYTLPAGWGWAQYPGDGAYYIVPQLTTNPGPVWLRNTPATDSNNSTTTPWNFDNQQ